MLHSLIVAAKNLTHSKAKVDAAYADTTYEGKSNYPYAYGRLGTVAQSVVASGEYVSSQVELLEKLNKILPILFLDEPTIDKILALSPQDKSDLESDMCRLLGSFNLWDEN